MESPPARKRATAQHSSERRSVNQNGIRRLQISSLLRSKVRQLPQRVRSFTGLCFADVVMR